jgi:polyisoprenoid-binding protein YceI
MTDSTIKKWIVDPVHSKIRFETKYLLLTFVSGWFLEFEGSVITAHDDFRACEIDITIYSHSVFTGNNERDAHLRSADFLDASRFPTIVFHSGKVQQDNSRLMVEGSLRIKGTEATVSLPVEFAGVTQDPMGNQKAGFRFNLVLNRKDFNITWNTFFDKQGVLVDDMVTVACDVQLLKVNA